MESGTGTVILRGGITMRALVFLLKLLLKILAAPVILALTLFVWKERVDGAGPPFCFASAGENAV